MGTPFMTSRRALLRSTAVALLAGRRHLAWSSSSQIVEDWGGIPVGATGVPAGWREYETPGGHPAYDFVVGEFGGRRALALKSAGEHSTIAKELHVRLMTTPILEWQWRMVTLPQGADLRQRSTSDAAGHLFVVWPRFPALLRSRLIGYVWDASLPAGTILPSRKTGTVTFVVVRSGREAMGQWVEERRDVVADYRAIFHDDPADPGAVALSIDTNDTRSSAETWFGRILFAARP